jgi:hypothetical protein
MGKINGHQTGSNKWPIWTPKPKIDSKRPKSASNRLSKRKTHFRLPERHNLNMSILSPANLFIKKIFFGLCCWRRYWMDIELFLVALAVWVLYHRCCWETKLMHILPRSSALSAERTRSIVLLEARARLLVGRTRPPTLHGIGEGEQLIASTQRPGHVHPHESDFGWSFRDCSS